MTLTAQVVGVGLPPFATSPFASFPFPGIGLIRTLTAQVSAMRTFRAEYDPVGP